MKYTREVLTDVVARSISVAEVARRLGCRSFNGGAHAHISKRIKMFGLDTNHFKGQGSNYGSRHKGGSEKLTWQEVLVKNRADRKEDTKKLRRAMIESGIPYVCGTCDSRPEWNGKLLVLQISHQNGKSTDNRKENLKFECPNCHSQTEDFGGRGARKNFVSVTE